MTHLSRIIFWQPFASPHQEAFLEAVAEQFAGEVILGVERPSLPPERVAQGWREPKHVRVHVVDVSKPVSHAALASHGSSDSLHVFTGFFSHPLVWAGFRTLALTQARLAIYSEAPEQPPLTGWLKRLRGRWLAALYAKRFEFVLAIGGIGCEFFERIGFPTEKIIPFGYYLAITAITAKPAPPQDGTLRFISAGQLIHRKGIDLLIKACRGLPTAGWRLNIFGDGPDRRALEQLTARLGLGEVISFHGAVESAIVQKAIASADCAILPSRFDGWGALITEAIASGTPVISTRTCGAAILLTGQTALGEVIAPNDPAALTTAMMVKMRYSSSARSRADIRSIAAERISPSRAAARFLAACSA